MAVLFRIDGLGHLQHAYRRRRHRPGIGADRRKAVWDMASRRVTGYEIVPLPFSAVPCRRPPAYIRLLPRRLSRADSTLRQRRPARSARSTRTMPTYDRRPHACRNAAVGRRGADVNEARRRASYSRLRVRNPALTERALQALVDEKNWERAAICRGYLIWGGYAYGVRRGWKRRSGAFRGAPALDRSRGPDQDNREHDLLDSETTTSSRAA